ncbi:MAG TPA: hypothetical protein VFM32_04840 [Spongiibacteraceae bacterium]|nr:hypothetical protein [Spongiibacteraceae bacterium]
MSGIEEENKDLVWDLDAFHARQLAADFIKRFENKLCVYSGSVEQLYTNYTIYFPEEESRRMVILPDPYSYHDTFQNVPEPAVTKTGMNIVPGEVVGKSGLYLTIPVMSNGVRKTKVIELQSALRVINSKRAPTDPFLPVLMKGDLREFQHRAPMLHLHRIKLSELGRRSQLERDGIRKVIERKLPTIN